MSATLVEAPIVWPAHQRLGARVFRYSLAVFIAVAVARVQDAVPAIAAFYPAKLVMPPLILTLVLAVPRWQLLSAVRAAPSKWMAVIIVLGFLSIPLSVWVGDSAKFFATVLIPSLVLFVATSTGFADRRTAKLCMLTLVVSVSAVALKLLVGDAPTILGRAYIGGALDPNDSAALFVTALPFAILFASERGMSRALGLVGAALLVAGVAKTGSRGGVAGLVAVACVLTITAVARRRWSNVIAIGACGAAFALTTNDAIAARFETLLAPQLDYNVTDREGRVNVWKRGVRYMIANPLLGVGLHGFETTEGTLSGKRDEGFGIRFTAAHNSFIQIGAELGVFGLVAFVAVFWSAAAGCRRAKRLADRQSHGDVHVAEQERRLADATICALVAIATTGFFLSLAYYPITFFCLAVGTGVIAGSPFALRATRPLG